MKSLFVIFVTFIISLSTFASIEVEVSEVYITTELTDQDKEKGLEKKTVFDSGVVVGALMTRGEKNEENHDKFYTEPDLELKAYLIFEGNEGQELFRKKVKLTSINAGVNIGTVMVFNKKMPFKNFHNKRIDELYGEFFGYRYGIAGIVGGVSYTSIENDYGVKIKDFDFRMGSKLDVHTFTTLVIEPIDTESNEFLDEVLLIDPEE